MTAPADAPSITITQYREALTVFGLDPDLVVSISITAQWVSLALIETDADGSPIVALGQATTRTLAGPLLSEDGAA